MKKNMIKLVCVLLTMIMVLGLAACGKEKAPSDPNHIIIGDFELQYKGASIMTDSEGKDAVVLTIDFTNNGKDNADYLWSIYSNAMQDGIGLETAIVYVSEDSYETVAESQFTEIAPGKTIEIRTAFTLRDTETPVEITFTDLLEKYKGTITVDPTALTNGDAGAESPESQAGEITAAPTGDALLDWWNGDWYGWWIVTGADGDFEGWNNNWWDCCANISIDADYTGSVIIWDETLPKDNAVSEASVSLNSAGTGEHGTLFSEGGYFLDGELSHADWIVDPGLMNYDGLICIDGWYEDETGSFKYSMYLRPWGTLWDDIAADDPDNLPYYYESWYLPLVEAGKAMPDVLGSMDSLSDAGQDNKQDEAETGKDNTTESSYDEYGKSNPDAVGIANLEDMQALYKICFENRSSAFQLFNYEDAKKALGCDGVVFKTPYAWNETVHTYRWETEDGKDYFNISFEMKDGEEWYHSCNMSENVINGLW